VIANNDNGNQGTNRESGYCKPPARTRFAKGQSGNRNGRPKGTSLTEIIKRVLAEPDKKHGTKADALIAMAEKRARKGDFRFFKELIDRNDGKVADQNVTAGEMTITVRYVDEVARRD
jgi:hypothetical protein